MHDNLKIIYTKTNPKICEEHINFEKPQIFQKNPKS